jgi:phenylacetate-coenzyme A ligase PaaK-like adenylate-forming protein
MLTEIIMFLRKAREYRRAERMTRADLEALQLTKFRKLVRHASRRSPYYARIIQERGIDIERCVPKDFPLLTKSLLMANFDSISTAPGVTKAAIAEFLTRSKDPSELFLGKYRVIHTSGSSGEVGYFVYSPRDWVSNSLRRPQRGSRPKRKNKGKFRMAFYGAADGHYAGVSAMASLKQGLAKLFMDVAVFEVNSPLPGVIDALNAFQPEVLIGYTTALKILAERQRQGALKLSLMGIVAAGEATTAADRAVLEQAFGCLLTNTYGCSEHLGMGSSRPGGSEIVLYDNDLIFEFYDDHCAITNLFNYTLPLIRYRMSDILRPVADQSKYAPYIAIESLVGRNELQPVFKNRDGAEDFISPHTINEIFVAGITRFQLHLTGDDEFRFMVCLDPALTEAQRADAIAAVGRRLREILERKRMDNVRFEVVATDDIPVNPRTRKFQLIVDRRVHA